MPLVMLGYLLSLLCGIHVVRSGRELYWIVILVIAPGLGAMVYFIAIILPEQMNLRRRRGAVNLARKAIDPEGSLREAIARADLSPTASNQKEVADELMSRGRHEQALEYYDRALAGPIHATDPAFMASKAHCLMEMRRWREAVDVLDELRVANPGWRNAYAHLDYAMAFEALGDERRALDEFAAVAVYFPGEEARVRHALLLEKAGQKAKADIIWREIRAASRAAPPLYRRQQREWLDIARDHDPDSGSPA
jgi:hypothetical protein